MLFDTDNDKLLSRNEVQTLIKFCQHYIFKIRANDFGNNMAILSDKDNQSLPDQQARLTRPNQISQVDRLSITQGNIQINDAYIQPDNIKILSKNTSKELVGASTDSAHNIPPQNQQNNQDKKQQQTNQKEIQKKQQILKAQQEKETMAYLFNKKQDKIGYQTFYDWAIQYFNVEEFFLMFELVPDPLLEREIIRAILKEDNTFERQVNQLLLEQRQKELAEEQQNQLGGSGDGRSSSESKSANKKSNPNTKASKVGGSNSDKLLQKEKFTETIYVVSWKWWFMWKYYINYAYKVKKMQNQRLEQEKNCNTNNNSGEDHSRGSGDEKKNATNAININSGNNQNTQNNKQKQNAISGINANSTNNNNNGQQQGGVQLKIGIIGEEQIEYEPNDYSNIANHQQSNNNTFFDSKDNLDSPQHKMKKEYGQSPFRRDSNNSRNSMVDLEFNNSIPSERQEEQRVKYHLQPNAFKNNLEFNLRNYQDSGSQNELNLDTSPNLIHQQQSNARGYNTQTQNVQYNNRVYGGEEDIVSDHNLFRPYSPSKVNHDLNNFTQAQVVNQNATGRNYSPSGGEKYTKAEQDQQQKNTQDEESYPGLLQKNNNFHNQPQESQVRSVSHNHQFQQGSTTNIATPRQQNMQMNNQNYQQDSASALKQQNFSSYNTAEKQLLTQQNYRDINDSDLFQNPNWQNQPQNDGYSPNKVNQYQDSAVKKGLIHPQQVQNSQGFSQSQQPQLLNFPETPQSTGGFFPNMTSTGTLNQGVNDMNQKQNSATKSTQRQVAEHNFVAHQNDIEAISQHNNYNSNNNYNIGNQQGLQNPQAQLSNINQKQQSSNTNDNQTMYNEVLHPETRSMNQSNLQFYQLQQNQQLQQQQQQQQQRQQSQQQNEITSPALLEEFNYMHVEQSERADFGQSPQEHVQQYLQRSVYAGQSNTDRNPPTVNPNVGGTLNLAGQDQNQNIHSHLPLSQIKNNEQQSSTLFSQTKFNICKPLQGLKGETHDLLSQDDLSKSHIPVGTNRNIGNFNAQVAQVEQSQFAREQQMNNQPTTYQNQTSLSPKKTEENLQGRQNSSSPDKRQNNQENFQTTTLNTEANRKLIDPKGGFITINHNAQKILNEDYIEEMDKGIQNTEEFGDQEEEEENKRVSDDHVRFQQYSGHNLGDRPTQIDNTDLEGEYQGELQKNIVRNNDYVIISEKAWEKLFSWYSGGPTFKRKRIVEIQKNFRTVELYPPLIIGYKCRKNGDLNYESRQELMVSSWKTLKEVMKKFQKYFKSEKQEDILYYKKMGSTWKRASDLDKTMLIDLQIESGTIFLFLNKPIEEKFLDKQRARCSGQPMNSYADIIEQYEIGDRICIFHPSERIEKKGFIFQIKNDTLQIHFKRESFRNDIIFEKKQLENYIRPENLNSQINIDQSITHLNNHIKYNPKMIGLANLGNTCFINCIIQFLVHTPFFRQYLLDEIYLDTFKETIQVNPNPTALATANNANGNAISNQPSTNPISPISNNSNIYRESNSQSQGNLAELQSGQISLIRELSQLTKFLKQKPYNDIYDPVKPAILKKAIDKLMPQFSGHEQHDAQEFLQGFLEKLNDEIKIKRLVTINKQEEANNTLPTTVSNQTNPNQNTRPTTVSSTQPPLQASKTSLSTKQDNVNQNKAIKTAGDEIFNTLPPAFPPEPISNAPLQPALNSQNQIEVVIDTIPNQKRDSGDKAELSHQQSQQQQQQQQQQATTNIAKQEFQEFSIIKDVYMGQTINSITCSVCGNVNHKYEDFFTISLPLPVKNEILYEVTYVPRIPKGFMKPIKKFGIKLHRSATYGEFQQAFYKTSKINAQFVVFAEIYKNNIIRNLYYIDHSVPMRNLGIRSNDEITAFEIINSNLLLEEETNSLYNHSYHTNVGERKPLKENDFVDFNVSTNKWVHGQIERITPGESKYEQHVSLKLIDDSLKQHTHHLKFKTDTKKIMPFRSQIPFYPKEKGYVVFVVNRTKMNNNMEKFGIPLCLIIPGWLTWKELHLLVFSQVKRCIDFNYLIKKYQATSKAQIKQKIKSAKTQGYTKLGGEHEEQDYNNAALTYQNDAIRSKERSIQEQHVQYGREQRQKAPSFHGFIEDNFQNLPHYEEDEYMRNRKSLFNYQQVADTMRYSSKSPTKNQYGIQDQDPPQLRPSITDYQNMYKASTSTHIKQPYPDIQEVNPLQKKKDTENLKGGKKNIKQSVNLEGQKKNDNSRNQNQFDIDQYFQYFNGEINDSVDFLQSSYFPYKLRVIDQTTSRCVICDLPHVPDNTQKEYCQGCEPGLIDRPIFWDMKQYGLLFTIDWKDSLSFNPSSMIPENDESYIDLKKQKNEIKMGIPIGSCFNLFSAAENVKLECDICKINQIQSTKHQIYKLPNILIIHLSRFQYQNGLFEKIDDLVSFPLKKLDLSQWVYKDNKQKQSPLHQSQNQPPQKSDENSQFSSNQNRFSKQIQDQNEIYDLFAVVNHLGNGHGGHYISFVNIKDDGSELKDCWVNFDDEQVSYITQDDVVSNKGYLLIYKKKFSTSAIVNLTYKKF